MSNLIFEKLGGKPEVPEFIIEVDDDVLPPEPPSPKRLNKWIRRLLKGIAVFLIALLALAAYKKWNYFFNIGIPTTNQKENIKKLQSPVNKEEADIVLTSDSILGVVLDFYAIHGLSANIEFEEPDTADTSVYLYCRSADHTSTKEYLGSLVVDGKELQSDRSRLGYMAMIGEHMVIGVSRFEKVKNYVKDNGGSFFRQFVLVSKGVTPTRFFLHGKVERKAIGLKDDTLYYIATRYKESLWDFADALREYGFTYAIYITGGPDYSYYRTADGERKDIGDISEYPHEDWKDIVPWLVFRKKGN